jgi:RND family efflux transporter MFP subunit
VAEVYRVGRGKAVSAVYGTVKVLPNVTMGVRSRVSGIFRLSEIGQKGSGTVVPKGTLLAQIVNEDLERELTKAATDWQAAKQRLEIGPPAAATLKTQEGILARLEKLVELNNAPQSELERARNEVRSTREEVRRQQLELERTVTVLSEQFQALQEHKQRGQIVAPFDGLISIVNVLDGDVVYENNILVTVETQATFLEGKVNEEDIGRILPKQKAAVRLYSYGDQDFTATVRLIVPTATQQQYIIQLGLDTPPPNLLSGMTGEMNVIIGERENALIVPSRAVLAGKVLVVDGGTIAPRAVKVGFRNIERSEIVEGLQEGDLVIVADQDQYRPGQRVRAVLVNR